MYLRPVNVRRLMISVAAILLSMLSAVPAPAVQNAGSGSPAQRLSEQDLRAAFERAQQALAAQDYPAAEQRFKDFLKLDPNSAAAYTNLGVVYMRTGKSDEAIRALETAKSSTRAWWALT